jgi:hypothetical protein
MNRKTAVVCALLLFPGFPSACAEPPAPWRRVEALEQFVVLTCAGDASLSWIVRSREEERKLFTPKFYETCRSGTLRQVVWPCCDEGGHQVVSSPARCRASARKRSSS